MPPTAKVCAALAPELVEVQHSAEQVRRSAKQQAAAAATAATAAAASRAAAVAAEAAEMERLRHSLTPEQFAEYQRQRNMHAAAHSRDNVDLHRARYRPQGEERTPEQYRQLYADKDWAGSHITLDQLDASKFVMHAATQRLLQKVQVGLVDRQYERFGRTQGSWDGYTLMFRNGWKSGDMRKPVTDEFVEFCEAVYCPVWWALLFGPGWEAIRPHWNTMKACTIKVTEHSNFYGDNIFHMHIDGKIGVLEPKNHAQQHMSRLLFSIVTEVVEEPARAREPALGTTVYPIWQPKFGFANNWEFHEYMRSLYRDRGLENSGLPRPHYEMPDELIARAQSGEVLLHHSHTPRAGPPQAIHSEPNPCPDRHLFTFDWKNIVAKDAAGKYLPSVPIPGDAIIDHMRVLAEWGTPAFAARLAHAAGVARGLLETAGSYKGGREAVTEVLGTIEAALQQQQQLPSVQ